MSQNIRNVLSILINGNIVSEKNTVKLTLNTRLGWKDHLQRKRVELDLKYQNLRVLNIEILIQKNI